MINTKNFNWKTGSFVIGYHLLFFILLPLYLFLYTPSVGMIIAAIIIALCCGLSITAGYHRLYAHRAYELNKLGEIIILGMGTLALENSVVQWAHDHRMHHRYVDTEKDPYSIKKGFLHAHILWLFKKDKGIDNTVISDLVSKKAVVFQHKYYAVLTFLANFVVVGSVGWYFHDFFGAFVFAFLARVFAVHHLTWFINSLAHTFGTQPYSKEHSAVNNAMIAFLTFGEGYHNYHHTFPSDYRNGVRWYQFDPTKVVIWCLAKIGVAKNVKKIELSLITRRMILEDKRKVLERIKIMGIKKWMSLEEQVKRTAESLSAKLSEKYRLLMQYRSRAKQLPQEERKGIKIKIKQLRKSINEEYKIWIRICSKVLSRKPQGSK